MFLALALILVLSTNAHTGNHNEIDFSNWTAAEHWPAGELNCAHGFRKFNEATQKRTYYVGVHADAGSEAASRDYNLTFVTYLNEAVGKRFDPPLEFKMKTSEQPLVDWIEKEEEIDFMYTDTGIFSCIGTEIGAQPLGNTISHISSRGQEYLLDVFAGEISIGTLCHFFNFTLHFSLTNNIFHSLSNRYNASASG